MQEEFIINCVDKISQEELDFKGIVEILFTMLRVLFCDLMRQILIQADRRLHEKRDSSRYQYKYKSEKTVVTILGEVTYERRYYIDRKRDEGVFLLDKQLGLTDKVGSHLASLAVNWALKDTFRSVRDKLEDLYGERVLSHETIRQLTYDAIRKFKFKKEPKEKPPKEKKAPEILIIEADEIYPGAQEPQKRKHEFKVAMTHTGWEPISGYSSATKFRLANKHYHSGVIPGEEFWELLSRKLYWYFDLSKTIVVINGDGAPWIRQGREYFDNALYSYNAYHVAKNLKQAVSHEKGYSGVIEELSARGDVENLVKLLAAFKKRAEKEANSHNVKKAEIGLEFIEQNYEYIRDYRDRLKEQGVDVKNLRNTGASEAIAAQFSSRIKRGRSWREENLNLMSTGLENLFTGKWKYMGRLKFDIEDDLMADLEKGAGALIDKPRTSQGHINGHFPALDGSNRSLKRALRSISSYDTAI